jgi:hypothetical protein
MQPVPVVQEPHPNRFYKRVGWFILIFNAYLILEVAFIGPQYNLYAILGPMLMTLGYGVVFWPCCILCGTPLALLFLMQGEKKPKTELSARV